jgi:hypothetical protein
MKNHWVIDYETLKNCIILVALHYKTDEKRVFVIHEKLNNTQQLYNFIKTCIENKEVHISYNGLAFDNQISEYIYDNIKSILEIPIKDRANHLYQYVQSIIDRSNKHEYLDYSERNFKIKNVDLFKLNHWDNTAKRSSLKWIQFSMNWDNLLDMPIHHNTEINTIEEIKTIVEYCINDCMSTREIFYRSQKQIALRKSLTLEYNINLISASEPKISKELFLHFLSEKTNVSKYELKQMQTHRDMIPLKKLILPYTNFNNPDFLELLDKFENTIVNALQTKGSVKFELLFRNIKMKFGLGGLHGANESGIYKADENFLILSSDVKSYYPNLAIKNKWKPAHLPKEFVELFEWLYSERTKISKKDIRNYVYKIVLNSTFGLSKDINSFLYDVLFFLQITVNGQLSLLMLFEDIIDNIPGATPILQNTDGLETKIPVEYLEKYYEICKNWEELTKLELEHELYQKIIVRDVNNYIAITEYKETTEEIYNEIKTENPEWLFKKENETFYFASTKCKGRFDFKDLALHKDKSNLVSAKALYYYYVHGKDPKEYIYSQNTIHDFLIGKRNKGNWYFESQCMYDGELTTEVLQKTIRYMISKKGCKIFKINKDNGNSQVLESGPWLQVLCNKIDNWDITNYDIDYNYYLKAVNTEINNINKKLTLL